MLGVRRGPVKGEAWSRGGEVCSCLGGEAWPSFFLGGEGVVLLGVKCGPVRSDAWSS
jgi:hypothetical protein